MKTSHDGNECGGQPHSDQRHLDGSLAARFAGGHSAGDHDGGSRASLYEGMDAAYDATEILEHSRGLGHVPIVCPVKRGRKYIPFQGVKLSRTFTWAEEDRFRERTWSSARARD